MSTINNPFFIITKQTNTILSWKQKKTLSIILIGLFICLTSILPFLLGVILIMGAFYSAPRPSFSGIFDISIGMNILMVGIDILAVSVLFNLSTDNGYTRIQSIRDLASKKIQMVALVLLILVFLVITFEYWFPPLTFSTIFTILISIGLLILTFLFQYFTIGMLVFGLYLIGNFTSFTIDFSTKRITKKSTSIWKKSQNTLLFDELTSLTIRPIGSRELRCELVLMCKDKSFQLLIASKDLLTDYVYHLQPFLNIPTEIV